MSDNAYNNRNKNGMGAWSYKCKKIINITSLLRLSCHEMQLHSLSLFIVRISINKFKIYNKFTNQKLWSFYEQVRTKHKQSVDVYWTVSYPLYKYWSIKFL